MHKKQRAFALGYHLTLVFLIILQGCKGNSDPGSTDGTKGCDSEGQTLIDNVCNTLCLTDNDCAATELCDLERQVCIDNSTTGPTISNIDGTGCATGSETCQHAVSVDGFDTQSTQPFEDTLKITGTNLLGATLSLLGPTDSDSTTAMLYTTPTLLDVEVETNASMIIRIIATPDTFYEGAYTLTITNNGLSTSATVHLLQGETGTQGSDGTDAFTGIDDSTIVTLESHANSGITIGEEFVPSASGNLAIVTLSRQDHTREDQNANAGSLPSDDDDDDDAGSGLAGLLTSASTSAAYQNSFILLAADTTQGGSAYMSDDLCTALQDYGANQSCYASYIDPSTYTGFIFVGYYGLEPGQALMRITTGSDTALKERVAFLDDTFLTQGSQALPPIKCSDPANAIQAIYPDGLFTCATANSITTGFLGTTQHIDTASSNYLDSAQVTSSLSTAPCNDGQVPVAYNCGTDNPATGQCNWSCEYIGLSSLQTSGYVAAGQSQTAPGCSDQRNIAQWNATESRWECNQSLQLGTTISAPDTKLNIQAPKAISAEGTITHNSTLTDPSIGDIITATSSTPDAIQATIIDIDGTPSFDNPSFSAGDGTITPPALRIHDSDNHAVLTINARGDVLGDNAYMGAISGEAGAFFGNRRTMTTSGYALKQTSSGNTTLHAANTLTLAVGNTTVASLTTANTTIETSVSLANSLEVTSSTGSLTLTTAGLTTTASETLLIDSNVDMNSTDDTTRLQIGPDGGSLQVSVNTAGETSMTFAASENVTINGDVTFSPKEGDEGALSVTTSGTGIMIDTLTSGHMQPILSYKTEITKSNTDHNTGVSCNDYSAAVIASWWVGNFVLGGDNQSWDHGSSRVTAICKSDRYWWLSAQWPSWNHQQHGGDDEPWHITVLFFHWSQVDLEKQGAYVKDGDGESYFDGPCPYTQDWEGEDPYDGFYNTSGQASHCGDGNWDPG